MELDQSAQERVEVVGARADMFGKRGAGVAIMFADEASFLAEAECDEAVVSDDRALERLECGDRELRLSRAGDRATSAGA